MEKELAIEAIDVTKKFNSVKLNYALNNISFQLKKGNVLGIIGNNGAGKSTLLRIISGLTKPDSGKIKYKGKLSYILDIGSCFHPDLSGLDNIYLVGGINGTCNKEIKKKIDSIIEFSELEHFINMPLKYYSNGMYLRLAFATNTSFYSDILLLDEIMMVGDINFQKKAKRRIAEIVKSGCTVILTGHNIEELNTLCTHGLWLSSGEGHFFGEINETIDKYLSESYVKNSISSVSINNPNNDFNGNLTLKFQNPQLSNQDSTVTYFQHVLFEESGTNKNGISLLETGIRCVGKTFNEELHMDCEMEIVIRYNKILDTPCILFVVIQDKFGRSLMSLSSHRITDNLKFIDNSSTGKYNHSITLPLGFFNEGTFSLSLYFVNDSNEDIASFERVVFFRITSSSYRFGIFSYDGNFSGSLMPFFDWDSKKE